MNVGNNSNSSCPDCKIPLSTNNIDHKYNVQFCSSCRCEFYPMKEEQKSYLELEYDLETVVSDDMGSCPVPGFLRVHIC